MTKRTTPRGIRNNNPLNIRIGNAWVGEVAYPTDPDFEQFKEMKYGLRAAFILLRRYIFHYRRTTLSAIVSAWAPSSENNTRAYIKSVSQLAGIPADATIDFCDEQTMLALVGAMIRVECGEAVATDVIREAYKMVL